MTIKQLVTIAEVITGKDISLTKEAKTYGVNKWIGSMQVRDSAGKKEFGCMLSSVAELKKHLYHLIAHEATKQMWLYRVKESLERPSWTQLHECAVDAGWDPSELAEAAGAPRATNVRVVDEDTQEGDEVDYW